MREAFHDQLDGIFADLSEICGQVEVAVREATKALMTGDVHTADQVIGNDRVIDAARERVDDTAFALLSLQQPVAGDLRMIVAALRMVGELERMGDLSVHVARVARRRVPAVAAIFSIVGRSSSGTATDGTRSRAILATWTERSPMRSSSLTIRSAETIIRRSPATGCWSESRANDVSSTRSRAASIALSLLITWSAVCTSPVISALVASRTATSTCPQMSDRSAKMPSSWSWKASRMSGTVGSRSEQMCVLDERGVNTPCPASIRAGRALAMRTM